MYKQINDSNKFLLVDDDVVILEVVTMMLHDMGINNVITGKTGLEAIALMVKDNDNEVNVIICDLNMPEMDGIQFFRHLADTCFVGSVILISGEDNRILKTAEKLIREHKLDLLGVLKKPINPEQLKNLLSKLQKESTSKPQSGSKGKSAVDVTVEELKKGIENNEMATFYQPKINLITRKCDGIETLVRWQHPSKGRLSPFYFVDMAENNGLIDALTQSVFINAIHDAAILAEKGLSINVAINISVETLNDLSWPDFAIEQLNKYGINPSTIILEITESRLIGNISSALEILLRLSMNKFMLSVDDFGTGYSSLEQLQRAPFTEMKIDRYFVNGASNNKSLRAILESSIELAKKLDMKVVAEGIENQEDLALIAELGCDHVQGYFFAEPMNFNDLLKWLNQWSSDLLLLKDDDAIYGASGLN